MKKKKLFLRICQLFFIILAWDSAIYAQWDKGQKDPFLSKDDKIKLAQEPLDISKLPYPVNLNGIVWTEKIQLAVINNETVQKDEQWRDFKVEDIQKEKVILNLEGKRFEIFLAKEVFDNKQWEVTAMEQEGPAKDDVRHSNDIQRTNDIWHF